jgi:hypothetical protein
MLANAVKQTTATAGAGPLTVAIVTNFLPLSQKFALNQPFQYSAYTGTDAAPVFREAGIGALTASNVMARLSVRETSDGTTSNTIAPTATDFGGASVTIICTPLPMFTESMLPTVDAQSSAVSRFLTSAARNLNTSPTGPASGSAYYTPFLLRCAATITSLAVNVTTAAGAGATAQIGIYACNEKGYVGARLAVATVDISTTGIKVATLSTPVALPPGWYYTALVGTDGTVRVTGYASTTSNMIGGAPLGFSSSLTMIDYRIEGGVAGNVLPAQASTTTSATNVGGGASPIIYLGVQ